MDLRKAINKLLTEDHKHEFGCAMLYFNFPQMEDIHNQIDKNDIYVDPEDPTFGLESEPHVTLLFGLHPEVTTEDITKVIDGHDLDQIFLAHNKSTFDNPKYDVLKFDVGYKIRGGNVLGKINNQLKSFPHTNDFPNYHPHMTIAYLNSNREILDGYIILKYKTPPTIRKGKVIIEYGENGEFIKEWNSINQAQKELKITGISNFIQGKNINHKWNNKFKYKE